MSANDVGQGRFKGWWMIRKGGFNNNYPGGMAHAC